MSDNLLEKVIVSTEIGNPAGSGLLNPEQSDRFIDYMFDQSVLLPQVRKERLRADTAELDKMGVGERIIRAAKEAVDTGENQGVFFSKISLTTTKIRLDWEISTETLEDNIEGTGFDDHVARLMAAQFGNDLEDLAINGDKSSSDRTLNIMDGWRKVLLSANGVGEGGAHVVDAGGAHIGREIFSKALKAMPRKFMQRRPSLRFFTGSGVIQDYLDSIVEAGADTVGSVGEQILTNGPGVVEGAAGFTVGRAFGVRVHETPYFDETKDGDYAGATGDHGDVWLTDPNNLIWAIKREVQVYRQFVQKKDSIEYTVYARVGLGVENTDAIVVVKNVRLAS